VAGTNRCPLRTGTGTPRNRTGTTDVRNREASGPRQGVTGEAAQGDPQVPGAGAARLPTAAVPTEQTAGEDLDTPGDSDGAPVLPDTSFIGPPQFSCRSPWLSPLAPAHSSCSRGG
jgi:hypothetical protein